MKLELIIRTAECENIASAEGWDSGTDRNSKQLMQLLCMGNCNKVPGESEVWGPLGWSRRTWNKKS